MATELTAEEKVAAYEKFLKQLLVVYSNETLRMRIIHMLAGNHREAFYD